jgi:hypothetical protein
MHRQGATLAHSSKYLVRGVKPKSNPFIFMERPENPGKSAQLVFNYTVENLDLEAFLVEGYLRNIGAVVKGVAHSTLA